MHSQEPSLLYISTLVTFTIIYEENSISMNQAHCIMASKTYPKLFSYQNNSNSQL
jgi:hypothetical protein